MIKSLKKRLIIIITFAMTLVLLAILAILLLSSINEMQESSFSMLDKDYFELTQDNEVRFDKHLNDNNDFKSPFEDKRPSLTFFIKLDEFGNITEVLDSSNRIKEQTALELMGRIEIAQQDSGTITDYGLRYKTYEQEAIIGFVDYTFEISFIQNQLINYGITLVGSLFIFFLVSLILSNIAVKPIKKNWEKQQQFIADASHELKTPISILLANSSMLLSNKNNSEADKNRWIKNMNTETIHMKKLVEELLFLAKSYRDKHKYTMSEFDLSDTIIQSILSFEALLVETNNQIITDIDENIVINGIQNQIKQLINILLDNARKYSYPNTNITISLKKDKRKIILTINNIGKVIPKEAIPHIFDRFYRSDKSRNRDNESYGLGLAISKEIVRIHNGEIQVASSKELGTTFIITLF